MAQLIRNRMNPPQRRKAEGMENFPKLKVKSNLDCVMYVDEEERANISANKLEMIPLKAGEYMLKFESVENVADYLEEEYTMPAEDRLKKVDLLQIKQDREYREQREREEREREQEKERKEREERERKEREARGEFEVEGVKFKMVKVEGGTFTMGATKEQGSDAWDDEKPAHQVTLSDYYIGETQVTQVLWKALMGNNPSRFKGDDNLPVERVSWDDAQVFVEKLKGKTGKVFRLPTEAEWEYAARGGEKSKGYKYSGSDNIDRVAWYGNNSRARTHVVKRKMANELGLYDMSGNVWEWCQDIYDNYGSNAQTDPKVDTSGASYVSRGGGWDCTERFCRVSCRDFSPSAWRKRNLGFRLVMCP